MAGPGLVWLGRATGNSMLNLTCSTKFFVGRGFRFSAGPSLSVGATFYVDHLPGTDGALLFGPGVTLGLRL